MIILRIYVPDRPALGTRWLVPGIMGGLLVALVLADPARIEGRARWLRRVAGVLILALAAVALRGDRDPDRRSHQRIARDRLGVDAARLRSA